MKIMPLNVLMMQLYMGLFLMQGPGTDDPGMPGGDPDLPPTLPETPLDAGVYVLIFIAMAYAVWRLRKDLVCR